MTDTTQASKQVLTGPFCGWCGEQLMEQGGKTVHPDGTEAGQCAAAAIKRTQTEQPKVK